MWYHQALFVHVVGVVTLFVALGIDAASYLARKRARSADQVSAISSVGAMGTKLHPVALVLILAGGVYMATTAELFDQAWIWLALGITLLMPVLGIAIGAPRAAAIHRAAHEAPAEALTPELWMLIHDPVLGTWNITGPVLAVWVLFLMALKPDLLVALIALGAALVLAAALALPLWRERQVDGAAFAQPSADEVLGHSP